MRTVASTKICSIAKEDGPKGGHEPFILNSVFDITQAAMHGRQHAHAAFNPLAKTEALIVNRIGDLGLWEANLGARYVHHRRSKACLHVFTALISDVLPFNHRKWHEHGVSFRSVEDEQGATFDELGTQADPFWQIAFGWEPGAAYLASCSTLYAIDFRVGEILQSDRLATPADHASALSCSQIDRPQSAEACLVQVQQPTCSMRAALHHSFREVTMGAVHIFAQARPRK